MTPAGRARAGRVARLLARTLDRRRWAYLLGGVAVFRQRRACPCCGEARATTVDRKLVYTLNECAGCGILYRHPRESVERMRAFYQGEYREPGLTTELPSLDELARLLERDFAGSPKDFSRVREILLALGLEPGHSVLDYGANWGYGTHQLRRAGFEVDAFELSEPRAAYGRHLGVEIHTGTDALCGPYDAVYSSHVLEHVPNPLATLREMLEWTRPGGFVVAHTPNGSPERRRRAFAGFHSNWGQVHPTLLTARFVLDNFSDLPVYVSTRSHPEPIRAWGGEGRAVGTLDGDELVFAIRRARG